MVRISGSRGTPGPYVDRNARTGNSHVHHEFRADYSRGEERPQRKTRCALKNSFLRRPSLLDVPGRLRAEEPAEPLDSHIDTVPRVIFGSIVTMTPNETSVSASSHHLWLKKFRSRTRFLRGMFAD